MVIYDLLTGMIVKELAGHQGVVRYSPVVVVSCLLIENLLLSSLSNCTTAGKIYSTNHLIRDVVAPVVIVSYLLSLDC